MNFMNNINFFTPVVFTEDLTFCKSLLQKVDGYFSLSDKRAFVISKRLDSYEVKIKYYEESNFSKLIFTVVKIISYMTIILPTIMLVAKLILRSNYTFKIKDIYIFGDIHGELEGFKENLHAAQKLIDDKGNWLKDNDEIVVQMGDINDRGPASLKVFDYLRELQLQAKDCGGTLIRLLGNHELMILQKNFFFAMRSGLSEGQCERLREQLIEDIKANRVILSWTDGIQLYIHAGLRSAIKEKLLDEMRSEKIDKESIYERIANHANELLMTAVQTNDFSHSIFNVGISRGGNALVGGLLWEDNEELLHSKNAKNIKQVVAHTPPKKGESPIRINDWLINVDAGLCSEFGSNHAFVQIHDKNVFVHEKTGSQWHVKMRRSL